MHDAAGYCEKTSLKRETAAAVLLQLLVMLSQRLSMCSIMSQLNDMPQHLQLPTEAIKLPDDIDDLKRTLCEAHAHDLIGIHACFAALALLNALRSCQQSLHGAMLQQEPSVSLRHS